MIRLKIRTKLVINDIISVLVIALLLGVAYINNKFLEILLTMILFYIFRVMFTKQFHSSTIFGCAIVSAIVFIILTLLEPKFSISILAIVIFTFMVNLISYYVVDYKESKNELDKYKDKFRKIRTKRIEELNEKELLRLLPDIKKDTIHLAYGYLHRDKGITANEYAYQNNISEPLIYKYVKQIKDAYKDLIDKGD